MTKEPPQPQRLSDAELIAKNKRMGLSVLAVVGLMLGVSFAAVPLYDAFCRITGFGGTTQEAASYPDQVLDRTVQIRFNADTGRSMPWNFRQTQNAVDVQLGQRGLTSYVAQNPTGQPVAGTAVYNVTPLKAGKYFTKVQCFCFDEQILSPGQKVDMPVMFYVDPAMQDDPNMDDVKVITLSYTFFKTESKELEEALEAFYDSAVN